MLLHLEKTHLQIPEVFKQKLGIKSNLMVTSLIGLYGTIIGDNRMLFFPEFTDHGLNHVSGVLHTAVALIHPETMDLLSEYDIAVFTAAVILHDIGMHIGVNGLQKLIQGHFDEFKVIDIDKETWLLLWEDYYQKASKFGDGELLKLFGTTDIKIQYPNFENLDSNSIKICGDFLRRYHHRLAHEIAIGGFPVGIGKENITIANEYFEPPFLEIAGLIARSHGIPLRSTYDYLKTNYGASWRCPYNIKVIYLMVVLRLSDYLQIQSERAGKIELRLRSIKSQIALQEWEKHECIDFVDITNEDPERIYVSASPRNPASYCGLVDLFLPFNKNSILHGLL